MKSISNKKRRECGKQITNSEGGEYVQMLSGEIVKLHKCNLKAGHAGSCGYLSRTSLPVTDNERQSSES